MRARDVEHRLVVPHSLVSAVSNRDRVVGAPHDFYRYPARFSPVFAREAIETFTKPGETVLDPFCGGGTTLVEAVSLGRRAAGLDVSSLAAFLARTKTTPISIHDKREIAVWLEFIEGETVCGGFSVNLSMDDAEHYLRNLPPTAHTFLNWVCALVMMLPRERQRRFVRMVLLGVGQWGLDCKSSVPSRSEFKVEFVRRLRAALDSFFEFITEAARANDIPRCRISSLRRVINRSSEDCEDDGRIPASWLPAKLVLTSPPYPGVHVVYHRWQIFGRKEDPGLVRLKPPPAQEARLLTAAADGAFAPGDDPGTSWALQSAGTGQMFVVNKGRRHGFLRCSCGYARLVKNPAEIVQIRAATHRTPYDQPCQPYWTNNGRPEDFAHVYFTDVLQIRIDRSLPGPPHDLPSGEIAQWPEAMLRTLVESVRLGAAAQLGIEQRDLAATLRVRAFGYPEVVLYDSAAGGAGYCQFLQKHGLRAVLAQAMKRLDCPGDCTHSCRCCLRGYDNQLHWDHFRRKPVLEWLRRLLGEKERDNPFSELGATPVENADPDHLWLGQLASPGRIVLLAARLFPAREDSADDDAPTAADARLERIAALLHQGGTLEIGLANEPAISTDQPHTIRYARILAPHLQSGRLKLFLLPGGTDPGRMPRVIANPGKAGSVALFSRAVCDTSPLGTLVPSPAWQSPQADAASVTTMTRGWQPLAATALDLPAGIVVHDYQPGTARNIARDFAFVKGKELDHLAIDDPFILKADANARCLLGLLEALGRIWKKFPAQIRLRTRLSPESDQARLETELQQFIEARGGKLKVDKIPAFGPKRRDLHDRRLTFRIAAKKPQRIEVLLTGGIDRHMEVRFESSVVVRRS